MAEQKEKPVLSEPVKEASPAEAFGRIHLLDEVRGFCVLCMLFYHTFIITGDYFGLSISELAFNFFLPIQPVVSAMFVFVCGISSRLSHSNWKRGSKLLILAILFSIITVYLLPLIGIEGAEDRFGILHLMSLCILLYAATEKWLNRLSPAVGIAICCLIYVCIRGWEWGYVGIPDVAAWYWPEHWRDCNWLYGLGIKPWDFYSADYFPFIPNVFIFLTGTFLGRHAQTGNFPAWTYPKRIPPLDWLGTHALLIYLLHVPFIYLISMAIHGLIH